MVEAPRRTAVPVWTTPATLPPAIRARDHLMKGGRSPATDTVAMVPAMTAAGVAMVSRRLSSQGM